MMTSIPVPGSIVIANYLGTSHAVTTDSETTIHRNVDTDNVFEKVFESV